MEEETYIERLQRLSEPRHYRLTMGTWEERSLPEWQDWIVDLLIKKHDEGLSDNQLRQMFAAEFDKRFPKIK